MGKKKKISVHIIGAGEIGIALAKHLVQDDCSVTIVDTDAMVIKDLNNALDVICYQGNGASYTTLQEAGAADSDIFIAVTDSDELNVLACLTAHMMGARHTVARVRNVEYAQHASFYRDQLGLSMTINPELAAALEISRVLRFPSATRVEVLANGRAELVEIDLDPASPLCGRSLAEFGRNFGLDLLICAVIRGEDIYSPSPPPCRLRNRRDGSEGVAERLWTRMRWPTAGHRSWVTSATPNCSGTGPGTGGRWTSWWS